MKHRARFPRRRHSGFALIITIVLVAFLVLLLVGLATFTRVETQVADNSQTQARARQNALLALNVAVGRLQAAAGPDTRVTATADIVTGRHIDKKNWTGVWNAAAAGSDKNIAWLVSGTAPAGAGGATSALTAASGNSLVELVGAGSTDISDPTAGNRVQVETQPLTSDTVPGLTGVQTIGNIAYWVGDEGVKAKVNLTDPWESPTGATLAASEPDTTASQAALYRFVHAQRTGIENMDMDASNAKLAGNYPATNSDFKKALPKVLELQQLAFAHTTTAGQTALELTRRHRFHDLSAHSQSVLSDVANGGLKKDLTAWIADTSANPTGSSDDYIAPGDDGITFGLPKWGLIRDYARSRDAAPALDPELPGDTRNGLSPVITYARMAFNLSCDKTTPSTPTGTGGGRYKYHIMPVVALWNPYGVAIRGGSGDDTEYELCFKYAHSISATQDAYLKVIAFATVPPATTSAEHDLEGFNLSRIQMVDYSGLAAGYTGNKKDYGIGSNPQFWRFRVRLTEDLQPGESRLLAIDDDSDGNQYSSGVSLLSDKNVDQTNSVYIPGGAGPGKVGSNAVELPATTSSVFLNTEPALPANTATVLARMQIRLTKPVPASESNIDKFLIDNSYQAIVGHGFNWITNTAQISLPTEMDRSATPLCAQHVELAMSALDTITQSKNGSTPTVGNPRWLALFNPQARQVLRKPFVENFSLASASVYSSTPSYVGRQYINAPASEGYLPYSNELWRVPFAKNDGNLSAVSAGLQVSVSGTGNQAQKLVLREFPAAGPGLFSLAQLQHANVSALSINPAYAIGNSLANLYVPRDATRSAALAQDSYPEATTGFPAASNFGYIYDISYRLNKALWDRYYFSTVPKALTLTEAANSAYRLPNARHRFHWNAGSPNDGELGELKATSTASKHLLLDGGFNVNSTSVQAWRALLASHNGVETDPGDSTKTHPLSRFSRPAPIGAEPNKTWLGYRILSDDQIDALAVAIVKEVKDRGPFLSLADFVNRRLSTNPDGLKGPLQATIDATASINDVAPFNSDSLRIKKYPKDVSGSDGDSDTETYRGGDNTTAPSASRAAFAPGYLTQADLLTAIGANLTARSDTFLVRAYGDVVNPATGSTDSRAWCEAIVQRLPDYVDPSTDDAAAIPAAGSTNATFGRRFKIVSYRWLSPDDL